MTEQLKPCPLTWAIQRINSTPYSLTKDECVDVLRGLRDEIRALTTSQPAHPDDLAVDRFAAAMKAKLAASRAKGRGGWDDPAQCTVEHLARLLVDHIPKGDAVDVANFAMMLHQRGADRSVLAALAQPAQEGKVDANFRPDLSGYDAFDVLANGCDPLTWQARASLPTQPAAQATPEPDTCRKRPRCGRADPCAWLEKQATQQAAGEPYGTVTVVRRPGCQDQHWFYRWPEPPYLDNAAEQHLVYTHPAPAVPEVHKIDVGFRWDGEAQQHIPSMVIEFEPVKAGDPTDAKGWRDRDALAAMLAAAQAKGE